MSHYEPLTHAEVGAELGVSPATVKRMIARGEIGYENRGGRRKVFRIHVEKVKNRIERNARRVTR
jgi:excisionase family DNA binding protein